MYYSFIIHLSVNVHLGCFPILAVMNNAVTNTRVHKPLLGGDFISFGYMLGHMGVLFLISLETSILFSVMAVLLHSHYSVQGFTFLYILTTL